MICHGHETWHPGPGILLQARRRPDDGHGPVLRHGACTAAGRSEGRHRHDEEELRQAHHHLRSRTTARTSTSISTPICTGSIAVLLRCHRCHFHTPSTYITTRAQSRFEIYGTKGHLWPYRTPTPSAARCRLLPARGSGPRPRRSTQRLRRTTNGRSITRLQRNPADVRLP